MRDNEIKSVTNTFYDKSVSVMMQPL